MYNMCAERVATEHGSGLSWHGVDREGTVLGARTSGDKPASTPDGVCDRDDNCRSCVNLVAQAVRPSPVMADTSTLVGDATQQNADLVAPNPGGHPRGH